MICCARCNVSVHQSCYGGLESLPTEEWLAIYFFLKNDAISYFVCRVCDLCASGRSPNTELCTICQHTGGAFRPTEVIGKWVHILCALWVPEVFFKDGVYNLSKIGKDRYKLHCKLCTKKGAKIQCSYGRCANAAHPWCAVKCELGFTHRIVKTPDSTLSWEVFCLNHASAVYDPVKPKVIIVNVFHRCCCCCSCYI
jgi:hypothetical protein